jgi:hypothetical protein
VRILAIDPGPVQSAWLAYDTETKGPIPYFWGIDQNEHIISPDHFCERGAFGFLAIEMVGHFGTGMTPGAEVYDTCVWIGQFINYFRIMPHRRILRREIKLAICGDSRAKDKNIRQALIDRWGGKAKAIGLKATPGPLYGIKSHLWSALAVAVCYAESINQSETP